MYVELYRETRECFWIGIFSVYYNAKEPASLHYFDKCVMHYIGGVSDRRWHDSLSIYCIDMA